MNGPSDLPEAPVPSEPETPVPAVDGAAGTAGHADDIAGVDSAALIELTDEQAPKRWAMHARAAGLVAMMGVPGVLHFVQPEFFDKLVPSWLPVDPRMVTHVSGGVEIASALLVAIPRTRRIGALASFATLVSVFPANVQAALDGGMAHLDPPMNTPAAAWIRLPFQLPMMWLALKVSSDAKKAAEGRAVSE